MEQKGKEKKIKPGDSPAIKNMSKEHIFETIK